tara:strand:+ start:610 stop:1152 length:543 start_codon:yes stop_codon:yes gene_type:complete
MLKINSQKITLILVALITVACSDPKDKYIAIECTETLEALDSFGNVHILVMDEDSKTFETYFVKSTENEEGPENSLVSGTYTEEGDHHYLYTWDLETFEEANSISPWYEDHTIGYFKIIGEPLPLPQFKIDRRNFSTLSLDLEYPDEPTWYETFSYPDCKVIDVPEDYLAIKRNKDVNLF